MPRKHSVVDEDGNELPPPEPGTDVANIIYLLEYGRQRGFQIGPAVKVGETTVQVRDLRQAASMAKEGALPDIAPGSDMAILLGD